MSTDGMSTDGESQSPTEATFDVQVDVRDESGALQWTFNGQQELVIDVPPGDEQIQLLLPAGIFFVTHPVNWFDPSDDMPVGTPEPIEVTRVSDSLCRIEDRNSGVQEEKFFFRVTALVDGKVVTSPDPTILNRKIDV